MLSLFESLFVAFLLITLKVLLRATLDKTFLDEALFVLLCVIALTRIPDMVVEYIRQAPKGHPGANMQAERREIDDSRGHSKETLTRIPETLIECIRQAPTGATNRNLAEEEQRGRSRERRDAAGRFTRAV